MKGKRPRPRKRSFAARLKARLPRDKKKRALFLAALLIPGIPPF